jgi:hypothetical protein
MKLAPETLPEKTTVYVPGLPGSNLTPVWFVDGSVPVSVFVPDGPEELRI